MTLVKICGISDEETALFAAEEGASFIGLVFDKASPRFVTIEKGGTIAKALQETKTLPIGVFTEHDEEEILAIAKEVGLKGVQLHGQKAKRAASHLPSDLICFYVLHVESNGNIQEESIPPLDPKKDFLLYDGILPGRGETFDWKNFHPASNFRFFLAGGLTPKNVQLAIKLKHPIGVDVSSGVEDPQTKKKDKVLIRRFIQKVREGQ